MMDTPKFQSRGGVEVTPENNTFKLKAGEKLVIDNRLRWSRLVCEMQSEPDGQATFIITIEAPPEDDPESSEPPEPVLN